MGKVKSGSQRKRLNNQPRQKGKVTKWKNKRRKGFFGGLFGRKKD